MTGIAPKPLAETVEDVGDFGPGRRLVVAGVGMGVFSYDPDHGVAAVDEAAQTINAAVEAREARLLEWAANQALGEQGHWSRMAPVDSLPQDAHQHRAMARVAEDIVGAIRRGPGWTDAVSGHVACALAFDLGAEKERTAAFGPLLDVLVEHGGEASQLAFALAHALGLRWPKLPDKYQSMLALTDDELRAECRRRGWHPEMGLHPRFVPFQPRDDGWEAGTLEVDPSPGPDEAVLMQYDGDDFRHVVRIRNIDAAGIVVDEAGPMPATTIAGWTRYEGGVGAGNTCANGRCSRFGTRHPGVPCDTRRARGLSPKR